MAGEKTWLLVQMFQSYKKEARNRLGHTRIELRTVRKRTIIKLSFRPTYKGLLRVCVCVCFVCNYHQHYLLTLLTLR